MVRAVDSLSITLGIPRGTQATNAAVQLSRTLSGLADQQFAGQVVIAPASPDVLSPHTIARIVAASRFNVLDIKVASPVSDVVPPKDVTAA